MSGPNGDGSPRLSAFVAVSIVAFVTLLGELLLTKLLSFVFWNHVVYLIISIALLGYGISSTFILVLEGWIRRIGPARFMAANLLLAMLSFFGAVAFIGHLRLAMDFSQLGRAIAPLVLSYLALVAPFFFAGNILIFIFFSHPRASHRLYLWDLVGAAAGCCAFPLVISRLGAVTGTAFVASLLAVPLVLFAIDEKRRGGKGRLVLTSVLLMTAAVFVASSFSRWVTPHPDRTKSLGSALANAGVRDEYSHWDIVTRLDIASSTTGAPIDLGWTKMNGRAKLVTFDGDAISVILPHSAIFPTAQDIADFNAQFPLVPVFQPAVGGDHLIIGLGGGPDIADSLAMKARSITAVDINGSIIEAMKGPYARFSGGTFVRPNVNVVHSEGRSYLRSLDRRFDLIQMRGVDTFAALSSGAYVLAENYLYTTNGLREYYRHLKPHGILSIQRWFFEKPRESLRLFAVSLEALRQEGVSNPEQHIIVIRKPAPDFGVGVTLVRRQPFTPDEVAQLSAAMRARGVPSLIYAPFVPPERSIASVIYHRYAIAFASGVEADFAAHYPYDISPVDDKSPFFFNYYRLSRAFSEWSQTGPIQGYWAYFVFLIIGCCGALAVSIFIIAPLFVFKRSGLQTRGAGLASAFFAALGLGFIMIEIVLMQKFALVLGHPMLSISTVLAGMLLFAGIGSGLAGRLASTRATALLWPAAIVALACIFFATPVSHPVIDGLVGQTLPVRMVVTLLLIMPLATALGFFFPTGMSIVGTRAPEFVAWAWGINAGFTVLGSVLAIATAMGIGFNRVLLAAAAIYLVGILVLTRYEAETSITTDVEQQPLSLSPT